MKKFQKNLILGLVMVAATIIGWVKGDEAKQKWMYKWKTSYEEKREMARKRMALREGHVVLDDIEWASYHNS